jgi:hypothetical protein
MPGRSIARRELALAPLLCESSNSQVAGKPKDIIMHGQLFTVAKMINCRKQATTRFDPFSEPASAVSQ